MGGYQISADAAFADIDPKHYEDFQRRAAPEYIATIMISFESHSTFSLFINPWPVCVTVLKYQPTLTAYGDAHGNSRKVPTRAESAGGIFVDALCVVDKNLVSGRTYRDSGLFIGAWIKLLENQPRKPGNSRFIK